MQLPAELRSLLASARDRAGRTVVLTGAGISAESGIPTFRGPEGFWTVGSENYRPEELATRAAFRHLPEEVWSWYLYRRSTCRRAAPNRAHLALVDLDRALGDGFRLITQNVDGLHLRAGSAPERTYHVHGQLDAVRCARACTEAVLPFPAGFDDVWDRNRRLTAREGERLRCPRCGAWLRPHVLWFDECYDEENYRFASSLEAASEARLLLVIGTSGGTNLPMQVCERVVRRGAPLVVVNRDRSPFSAMAEASDVGYFARGSAGDWVPPLVAALGAR